jgi:hypothetical protein
MIRWPCTTVVILLAISLHALAAPAPSPSCLVSPGRSIGPLSLGMARDEVIQLWGSPDSVEARPKGGQWMEYALLRLGLVGLNGEGKVELIAVDDDSCLVTTESIVVGDPRGRVYSVYGILKMNFPRPSTFQSQVTSDPT